jgi:hypothetical protein
MVNLPCRECIVFPICKNRLHNIFPSGHAYFSESLVWSIWKCASILNYIYSDADLETFSSRTDEIIELFSIPHLKMLPDE